MKNVDVMVRVLERAGVKWVFGVPSGPVLPLIEALRGSPVEYILTASETTAGFMASAVGALTGTPGVCVSTLGPGATNLATGVGAAWLDSAPVLAITCNVPTPWLNRRIQMRIDHHALFSPISKASVALTAGDFEQQLVDALCLAASEPPGPVHLDLPEDVGTTAAEDFGLALREPAGIVGCLSDDDLSQLEALLAGAKRPVVVAGLGLTRAQKPKQLLRFIEQQHLPFVLTLHAKGFLPESHDAYAGVIGRARRSDVQAFVNQSDLVIAVGYDEIEINYEEWLPKVPVVHISNRVADVDDSVSMRLNFAGDLDAAIGQLGELSSHENAWSALEWRQHRERLDANLRPAEASFTSYHVLDALRTRLPADGILAYDVGAHTHQIASQWRTDEPLTCISTNGWSSMGYGIPATYAAKLVHPEKQVVGVIGDGCFQMTAGELAVGKRLGLAAPIVVLNDGWLGLIKVKQERRSYGYNGVNLGERAPTPEHYFGVPARAVHNIEELNGAFEWALSLDGPSVIEAFVDVEPYSTTVYD